jgi:hypothetical protein
MTRLAWVLLFAGCNFFRHEDARDAGAAPATPEAAAPTPALEAGTASPDASVDDDEEPFDAGLGDASASVPLDASCSSPIHPSYCRRRCRGWFSRKSSMHARRIPNPARAGTGTCGGYNVFAEDTRPGGSSVVSGILDFYDPKTDELVGALDTRIHGCQRFGVVPKCTPTITWGSSPSGKVNSSPNAPNLGF